MLLHPSRAVYLVFVMLAFAHDILSISVVPVRRTDWDPIGLVQLSAAEQGYLSKSVTV